MGTAAHRQLRFFSTLLAKVTEEIRDNMILVMRHKTIDEVRRLCGTAKALTEALVSLAQNPKLWAGVETGDPRRNEQIFRDLIRLTTDEHFRGRLHALQATLRQIQFTRNRAAHASIGGEPQELNATDAEVLRETVLGFVGIVSEIRIGRRAALAFDDELIGRSA